MAEFSYTVPNDALFVGAAFHGQGMVFDGSTFQFGNGDSVTVTP